MFKRKPCATDLIASLVNAVADIRNMTTIDGAHLEEISKAVGAIKAAFYGKDAALMPVESFGELTRAVFHEDILVIIVRHLEALTFETRKDLIHVILNLSQRAPTGAVSEDMHSLAVDYIQDHPEILEMLLDGYKTTIPLSCGTMLKEFIKVEPLAALFLKLCDTYQFKRIFVAMNDSNFETSSDASILLKDLLTRYKSMIAKYFEERFEFFTWFEVLLTSANYATRRFSLNLLSGILLDRTHFTTMTRYIASDSNLKLIMTLLKDPSQAIRYESFHIFKVFVANPNKNEAIVKILAKNKERLIEYLKDFSAEDNEEMEDEKFLLIREISKL